MNPAPSTGYNWIPTISLVLALAAVAIVYFTVPGDPMRRVVVVASYAALIMIFFLGLMVLIAMATGKIDLGDLLSESEAGGGASMARFQLLVFTFVIGLSFFIMVASS